ncbi:hypothetical protein GCM10011581_22620 [Saccharopolyspora subtropica]|uniref:Uncharacterized protein n=1 Tax=Saccharopolyspora thermophila TaxID=89367 RepID=A0A917JVX6_9PSEU|nr:hypothetical protein [Saccharopolyspora subtropica]GGI85015.1 hypothetical protein GCM10011581_22620 [Saccharopolyspora subtropica]
MGEQWPVVEWTEQAPIYDALAAELCDPASTDWRFSAAPTFLDQLTDEEPGTPLSS